MMRRLAVAALLAPAAAGCDLEPRPDERDQQVGYRSGTGPEGWLSNGERGNAPITEVHWAGSVERVEDGWIHDPRDIFIEVQNRHPRPIHLTRWVITVETGLSMDTILTEWQRRRAPRQQWLMPARESGRPVEPGEFVIIAARRDGAFARADYFIEDLRLPLGPFSLTLHDVDERLIDQVGDHRKPVFAGAWDLVTARSMERTQLLFNNRGDRDMAWHSYSFNDFSRGDAAALHVLFRQNIAEPFRARTFASPGMPNSPTYAGNVSSGELE
jgi:hypothetical protein